MPVYLAINRAVASADIRARRRWDPELDLIAPFVHSGDTVIDVGANHGLYSFHLSRMVGESGTVHAFEPIPFNFKILVHTTRDLKNVVRHKEAVGEQDSQANFVIPIEHRVPFPGLAHHSTANDAKGIR